MERFFNSDSPFMKVSSWIVDLIVLNLLTLLVSLPVITFGAAYSALYQSLERLSRDEGNIYSGYFQSFRTHFRQATYTWVVLLAAFFVIVTSFYFYWNAGIKVLTVFVIAALIVWLAIFVWVFPLLTKSKKAFPQLLREAFFAGIGYFPKTILMIVLHLLPVILLLYPAVFVKSSFVLILIWFSLVGDVSRRIVNKVIKE